jgi:hypothetical protein
VSRLREELARLLQIGSPMEFARRGDAPGYIAYATYNHEKPSRPDRRATLVTFAPARTFHTEHFRASSARDAAAEKRACLRLAGDVAEERFNIPEWRQSPWPDAWVPAEAYNKVMAELKAARKTAKEADDDDWDAPEAPAATAVVQQGDLPALISVAGLVARCGKARQYVASLMDRKGAPEPVAVEGLTALVFRTEEAVAFLKSQGLTMNG